MNLFFLIFTAIFLNSCQSTSSSSGDPYLSNPIKTEYKTELPLSDYDFFKNSLPSLTQRLYERSKRWALLKESPDVLSYSSLDLLEPPYFRPDQDFNPDPSLSDWVPWWIDVLKIEISYRLLTKNPIHESLNAETCVALYQKRLATSDKNPPLSSPKISGIIKNKNSLSSQELWKSASNTSVSEKRLVPWLTHLQLVVEKNPRVREYYFSKNGVKRRLFLIQQPSAPLKIAIELPQDPMGTKNYFSKSGQSHVCERFHLALSLSGVKEGSFRCADLEGSFYVQVPESYLIGLLKAPELPPENEWQELYKNRCESLADHHSQQWVDSDRKRLALWLKRYPQIGKRLRYFANMESKVLLSKAAESRSR